MVDIKAAFTGFSVDDLSKAKEFYSSILGLKLEDKKMGLQFRLPGGGKLFIYEKSNHQPATYTVLNFVVEDIDAAVDELTKKGVTFENYHMKEMPQDGKGIARGKPINMGPNIAWLRDPAGNILSVIEK